MERIIREETKKYLRKFIIPLIIVSVVPFIFFIDKTIIQSTLNYFINDAPHIFEYVYSWHNSSFGDTNLAVIWRIFPLSVFYYFFNTIFNLSPNLTQFIFLSGLFFVSAYSFCLLITELFDKNKISKIALFIGAVFFLYNPYVLTSVASSYFLILPYMLLPMQLYFYIRGLRSQKILKFSILFGLSCAMVFGVNLIFDVIAVFLVLAFGFWSVFISKEIKFSRYVVISFFMMFFMMFFIVWWIVPMIYGNLIDSATASYNLGSETFYNNDSSTKNIIRTLGDWAFFSGYKGVPYRNYSPEYRNNPLVIISTFLLPVLIFIPLIFLKKIKDKIFRKKILFFYFLIVLLMPFIGGTHKSWPTSGIVEWMFENIPYFMIFRNTYKWTSITVLFYAILLVIFFSYLINKYYKTIEKRFFNKKFVVVCLALVLIVSAFPFVTGRLFGAGSQHYKIPYYWYYMADYVNEKLDETKDRIMLFPDQYFSVFKWDNEQKGIPVGLARSLFKAPVTSNTCKGCGNYYTSLYYNFIYNNLEADNLDKLIGLTNISYLLQRNDYFSEYYNVQTAEEMKDVMDDFEIVEPERSIGELDLYKLDERYVYPRIYSPEKLIITDSYQETLGIFDNYLEEATTTICSNLLTAKSEIYKPELKFWSNIVEPLASSSELVFATTTVDVEIATNTQKFDDSKLSFIFFPELKGDLFEKANNYKRLFLSEEITMKDNLVSNKFDVVNEDIYEISKTEEIQTNLYELYYKFERGDYILKFKNIDEEIQISDSETKLELLEQFEEEVRLDINYYNPIGIEVGDKVFYLDTNKDDWERLGSVKLEQKELYSLNIYGINWYDNVNLMKNGSFEQGLWRGDVANCNNQTPNARISMSKSDNASVGNASVMLYAEDDTACTNSAPVTRFATGTVYFVSFDYKNVAGSEPAFCAWDGNGCALYESLPASMDWQTHETIVKLDNKAEQLLLYIYAHRGKEAVTINLYDNFKIYKAANLIETVDFTLPFIPEFKREVKLASGEHEVTAKIHESDENLLENGSFEDGNWKEQVGNCRLQNPKAVLGMKLDTEEYTNGTSSLKLIALDDVACINSLPIRNFSKYKSYAISFDYKIAEGDVSRFCVWDSKTCLKISDIEKIDNEWHRYKTVFNPNEDSRFISVYLYASAENVDRSEIYYDNIVINEVDNDILNAYKLKTKTIKEINNAEVAVEMINTTKYYLNVKQDEDALLIFQEAFNPGWHAYIQEEKAPNNFYEKIKRLFGMWPEKRLSEDQHIIANGFENSWYINKKDILEKGEYELILEFWPQRIFYVCSFISILTAIVSLIYILKDYIQNSKYYLNHVKTIIHDNIKRRRFSFDWKGFINNFKVSDYFLTLKDLGDFLRYKVINNDWKGIILLLIILIVGLKYKIGGELLIFSTYVIMSLYWRYSEKVAIYFSITLILISALLMILFNNDVVYSGYAWADRTALWAYYFFAIGVFQYLISTVFKR